MRGARHRSVAKEPLRPRQAQALLAIADHTAATGSVPTMAELRAACGIGSMDQALQILSALNARGLVRCTASGTLGGITEAGLCAAKAARDASRVEVAS